MRELNLEEVASISGGATADNGLGGLLDAVQQVLAPIFQQLIDPIIAPLLPAIGQILAPFAPIFGELGTILGSLLGTSQAPAQKA